MTGVVIDASEIFRIGFKAACASRRRDLEIVDDCDRVDVERIARVAPDALFVDLAAPGAGSVLLRGARERLPPMRVVVLGLHAPPTVIRQVLDAGAAAVVCKTDSVERILAAVDATSTGGGPRLPGAAPPPEGASPGRRDLLPPAGVAGLSRREREVFDLVALGASNKEMAQSLSISVKTIETHRCHINAKLGAHSPADIVRIAARLGVLERRP